ncbi:hypothetical protein L210DRAFT_988369 [Boletus edulis BED1]|uniref:Uncharacterized protein n=1 Tax=Boletus edulis BED1 TaxID=1328754 RepID=A0AAD4BGF2_BOLED|nr:hypothetical protein L210DRAFT_988369 [Boletus edulis BED1]
MTSQWGSGYHTHSLQPSLKMLASFCKNHFRWDGDAAVVKMRATVWEDAELHLLCGLEKQPDDVPIRKPQLRFIHYGVVDTVGSRLIVFKVRLDTRQFSNVVHTALLPPLKRNRQEYMFVTLPACIVEHVYLKEMWCNVDGARGVLTVDANVKAQQRVELHAFLHADAGQSIPAGSTVIDLTEDSGTENPEGNLDADSDVQTWSIAKKSPQPPNSPQRHHKQSSVPRTSLKVIEQLKEAGKETHLKAANTKRCYAGHVKCGHEWLTEFFNGTTPPEDLPWLPPGPEQALVSQDGLDPYADPAFARAFDSTPNKYSDKALSLYLTYKGFHQDLRRNTVEGVRVAFKDVWD